MNRKFIVSVLGFSLLAAPAVAYSATHGININLRVPLRCQVSHQPINFGAPVGSNGISLGKFSEFCNSPSGYKVMIVYTPGTLAGTRLTAGDENIVLNGSGRTLLSQSAGPRIMERSLIEAPGADGFNSDRIELQIEVN